MILGLCTDIGAAAVVGWRECSIYGLIRENRQEDDQRDVSRLPASERLILGTISASLPSKVYAASSFRDASNKPGMSYPMPRS